MDRFIEWFLITPGCYSVAASAAPFAVRPQRFACHGLRRRRRQPTRLHHGGASQQQQVGTAMAAPQQQQQVAAANLRAFTMGVRALLFLL